MSSSNTVFGFVLLGGTVNGAQIYDIRQANELHRRGYPVHVWWIVDKPHSSMLDAGIPQHWLCHSFRYATGRTSGLMDTLGRLSTRLTSDKTRSVLSQRFPWFAGSTLRGLIRMVCRGIETDSRLIRQFARELTEAGVTHATGTIEILGSFLQAAQPFVGHRLRYLVRFQGYETYAPYAARLGLEEQMYDRIRESIAGSDWQATPCSAPYGQRVNRELGIPVSNLHPISPGVPISMPVDLQSAIQQIQQRFPVFNPSLPLISYLGRRDSEKGIDLLLYAAQILRTRQVPFQLAICGPTAFGSRYSVACRQIAEILRLPVITSDFLTNDLRSALFRASYCVVYPSIHEEPFGMVPVEAMVQGTPVVVADTGGVAELPFTESGQGGLVFRSWDSGDLANQLQRLLTDQVLHTRLSQAAPGVAARYSVENSVNRLLDHMEVPRWPSQREVVSEPVRRAA